MLFLNLKTISEAGINFLLPEVEQLVPEAKHIPRRSDPVFYNAKQSLNRDISIMMLHAIKNLQLNKLENVVETFAGTGIRALRYALQGPKLQNLYINDISPPSINLTKDNFALYKDKITTQTHYYNMDAKLLFLELRQQDIFLDFIDIDPYGTPQPYLRNALLTLENSGVLAITATDMPVITGKYPEKAYRLYQIPNFKVANRSYCHEIGLRMLIAYVQREALFYKLPLVPLLSYYCDHYVRAFLHHDSSVSVDKIIQTHGYITDCSQCGKREFFSWKDSFKHKYICSNCSSNVRPLGPLYLGPLHQNSVVVQLQRYIIDFPKKHLIDRRARLERMIPLFKEDLKVNLPWYYELGYISKKYKLSIRSPALIIEKLHEKGFDAGLTHFDGQSIRTNYPLELGIKQLFD